MSSDDEDRGTPFEEMNIYEKLFYVQRQIPLIPKDAQNERQGFNYATSAAVLTAIRKAMDEAGLLLLFDVRECEIHGGLAYGGKQSITQLAIEATWVNVHDPEDRLTLNWPGLGADDGEKGVGKALTYGEKYGLLKMFHIPTDDVDPDADAPPEEKDPYAPKCPKCGATMRKVYSKKNEQYFWSCPHYPDCNGSMSLEEGMKASGAETAIRTSQERPEDNGTNALWEETWRVIEQSRGYEKNDPKAVSLMEKWAEDTTDGEIVKLDEWPPDLIIRFRAAVDKEE